MADDDNSIDNPIKESTNVVEVEKLTWDEYKYRHDLCWRTSFKLIFAVTTLSVIPHLESKIIDKSKDIVFVTAYIAIVLSIIGLSRLTSELRLLDKMRYLHRKIQNANFKVKIFKDNEIGKINQLSQFSIEMIIFHWLLMILTIINAFIISEFRIE